MQVTGKLLGLENELRRLKDLKAALQNRIVRKAIDAGGKVVEEATKSLEKPHDRTGALGRALGRRTKTYRSSSVTVCYIGARRGIAQQVANKRSGKVRWKFSVGKKRKRGAPPLPKPVGAFVRPTRYFHLLEGGHQRGQGRGAAAPHPTLGPAAQATQGQVEQTVVTGIADEISRVMG